MEYGATLEHGRHLSLPLAVVVSCLSWHLLSTTLYIDNAIAPSLPLMLLFPRSMYKILWLKAHQAVCSLWMTSLSSAIVSINQASVLVLSANDAISWHSCRLSRYDESKSVYPLACRPRNTSQTVSSRRYQCVPGDVSQDCHSET